MPTPAKPLLFSLILLSTAAHANELRPLALDAQEVLGFSSVVATEQAGSAATAGPRLQEAIPAPAQVQGFPVAPPPSAPAVANPNKLYEVRAGEMASEVFGRWLRAEGVQLIWETRRDFRLEAGARFNEASALEAVRSVAEVLGRTHPDFVVRAFSNGVVVVMDRN
ncbi:TcpQ domain-containing protein [Luteimonas sp. MHLX1A]|uniref:TcpQ domain-containing protein n=1 Tax=Alterluteimonas muca TaxID=2878684 RepID=UPI001E4CA0AE|nr:TcpQ domain-containing protein [Luteimonas sp. MHLX1A]MCD9046764.1 toxin co-regulated pilus biosynthesis Q family protein [Luteimonas sp. MHLX1A]